MEKEKKLIAFDGDDTLWENMTFYLDAAEKIKTILGRYADMTSASRDIREIESANIAVWGYGTKSFVLSMIEVAIKVSSGKVRSDEIQEIIDIGKPLTSHPIKLLPDVREVIGSLSPSYELMLLTKGDLSEQKSKIVRSGLSDFFKHVEIVGEKDKETYSEILEKHRVSPEDFLMIGNSMRSDILPVMAISGNAAHVPHKATWHHEEVAENEMPEGYFELDRIAEVPGLLNGRFGKE